VTSTWKRRGREAVGMNGAQRERAGGAREPQPWGLEGIRPTRRRTLTQEIVEQLLDFVAGQGTPEQRLPSERRLCERLGVSRTSLREALAALVELGVLDARGKIKYGNGPRARAQLIARGAKAPGDRQLITDPLEARRMLEPEVAAMAASRANEQALDEVRTWVRLMDGVARHTEVLDCDCGFHVAIARATGNGTLVQLVRALTDSLRESRELSFIPPESVALALDGHRVILDALEGRDPRKAREAMSAHLDQVEQLIRASVRTPVEGNS
jgi:GntR family transcriptional regulator, transcriptional repressor for pyruvate dehydrogenase complex